MTFTIDWGAVVAMGVIGSAGIAITRLFVREEIRKVTSGKFGRIEQRIEGLEISVAALHGPARRRAASTDGG